ncbi:MAG: pirin family protein, partial [Actinomycetota bacterium]
MSSSTTRSINQIITSRRSTEGGGFVVRRPFPTPAVYHIDPFLLLDEMGPAD